MSILVKTEHDKVTEVESLSKGMTSLSVISNISFSALAGLSLIIGTSPEATLATTAIAAGNLAWTSHWVTHDLTKNLRNHNVLGSFKSSVFALWGKKKVYPVSTVTPQGKEIQAEIHIGRGKTHLVEYIPVEPLDLWDTSMMAVRDLYNLRRKSPRREDASYDSYNYGYHDDYYIDNPYSSYDETLDDYYHQVDNLRKSEERIKEYEEIIASNKRANCQSSLWKEKQQKLKSLNTA